MSGLIIFPTGDWYSEHDGTSGNIISLIQRFTGMCVRDAIEWTWKSFLPINSSYVSKVLV